MRKYFPRIGTVFTSREDLLERLERSGWKFEGQSTGLNEKGKIIRFGLGVRDKKKDLWLIIDMKLHPNGVQITKIKKLRISDYQK